MSSISKSQVEKKQAQLFNGWKFDVRYYVFHSEYSIKQYVDIGNNKMLEFSIGFMHIVLIRRKQEDT